MLTHCLAAKTAKSIASHAGSPSGLNELRAFSIDFPVPYEMPRD